MKGNKGWHGDSYRHSLAARGVRTSIKAHGHKKPNMETRGSYLLGKGVSKTEARKMLMKEFPGESEGIRTFLQRAGRKVIRGGQAAVRKKKASSTKDPIKLLSLEENRFVKLRQAAKDKEEALSEFASKEHAIFRPGQIAKKGIDKFRKDQNGNVIDPEVVPEDQSIGQPIDADFSQAPLSQDQQQQPITIVVQNTEGQIGTGTSQKQLASGAIVKLGADPVANEEAIRAEELRSYSEMHAKFTQALGFQSPKLQRNLDAAWNDVTDAARDRNADNLREQGSEGIRSDNEEFNTQFRQYKQKLASFGKFISSRLE